MLSKEKSISSSKSDVICWDKETFPVTLNLHCNVYIEAAEIYTLRRKLLENVLEKLCNDFLKDTLKDVDEIL